MGLTKQQNLFDLIIGETLENKIRFLCKKSPNLEWSGVLFYDVINGDYDKDLKIKAVDVLPLNQGSGAETSYTECPEIMTYQIENNLMDCKTGLIHSHHNMQTFFSGTDLNTLESEGKEKVHFLSLIINNAGIYNAAFTKKVKYTGKLKEINTTFNNKQTVVERDYIREEVLYMNANISFEKKETNEYDDMWKFLQERTQIDKEKTNYFKTQFQTEFEFDVPKEKCLLPPLNKVNQPNQLNFNFNKDLNLIACKLVSCNLLYGDKNTPLKQIGLYYLPLLEKNISLVDFECLITDIIDIIFNNTNEEPEIFSQQLIDYFETSFGNKVETNKYLNVIINTLEVWA